MSVLGPTTNLTTTTPILPDQRKSAGCFSYPLVQRDRSGHYVVPGSVNGVAVEFLLDTGATDVAIPPAIARQLRLTRGVEVEIETASDIVPGYLVTLDEVSIGPLSLERVRGSVSERSIHDEVLLGMSFLRHFELAQRGRTLTLRVPANR